MTAPDEAPNLWNSYTAATMPSHSEVSWTWRGRLPSGQVAFLGGPPGIGKSLTVWGLALSTSVGRPFLDTETTRGAVFYYDFDSEPGAQGLIMHKVRRGLQVEAADLGNELIYRTPAAGLPVLDAPRLASIADEVRKVGPVLVIIDAWTSALWTVRSNDTEQVAEMMALLKVLAGCGATVLIIDHAPKPVLKGASAVERGIIGSTMKVAGARAAYLLGRVPSKDVGGRIVTAMHTLKNNLGPLHDPLGIEYKWRPDAVTITVTDLPEAETAAPARMRAMAALREIVPATDLITRSDVLRLVGQRAGVQTRTIEDALGRLIANDEVEAVPLSEDRRARGYRLTAALRETTT